MVVAPQRRHRLQRFQAFRHAVCEIRNPIGGTGHHYAFLRPWNIEYEVLARIEVAGATIGDDGIINHLSEKTPMDNNIILTEAIAMPLELMLR